MMINMMITQNQNSHRHLIDVDVGGGGCREKSAMINQDKKKKTAVPVKNQDKKNSSS